MGGRGDWKQWNKGKTRRVAPLPKTPSVILTASERARQAVKDEHAQARRDWNRAKHERKEQLAREKREARRRRIASQPNRPDSQWHAADVKVRYGMSDEEREAARLLASCRMIPDSWEHKFATSMLGVSYSDSALLTQSQRLHLWKMVHRYRNQIKDQHLLDIARQVHEQTRRAA